MGKPNPRMRPVLKAQPAKVIVAYIHPGQTSAHFTQSLTNLVAYDQKMSGHIENVWNEWSSANISSARNSLTKRFLEESRADWLLWVDADMAFEHDAIVRLLESADPEKAPIVGGLCFGATLGQLFPTIYQMTETEDGRLTALRVKDYPLDSMVGCAATGAAFLLIHRRVVEAIAAKKFNEAFPFFQEMEVAGQPAGEDLVFCFRAGNCGFPIYVNTAVKVGHHKSILYTHEMFQAQKGQP